MSTQSPLLTQNRELQRDKVWNWTLPAWVVTLPGGKRMNVCPNAGACVKVCYARNGTYLFPKVKAKHLRNLELALSKNFTQKMLEELNSKKYAPKGTIRQVPGLHQTKHLNLWTQEWLRIGGQAIRIHDAGDFFSREYLQAWITIATIKQDILFYAYTKEVAMVKNQMLQESWPNNFLICFSMGGKQDHLINKETDYHADVFPDQEAITVAGYASQNESDLLCVLLPNNKIGIPQNNIPTFKKRLQGKTFSEAEAMLRRHHLGN